MVKPAPAGSPCAKALPTSTGVPRSPSPQTSDTWMPSPSSANPCPSAKSSTGSHNRSFTLVVPADPCTPLSLPTHPCFSAISRGEFLLNGFRNRDLQELLHPSAMEESRGPQENFQQVVAAASPLASSWAHLQGERDHSLPTDQEGPNRNGCRFKNPRV